MYLGIDLGTSAVKVVLMVEDGAIVAQASAPLELSRPHPLWSEQKPEDWWQAAESAVGQLRNSSGTALRTVRAIGLSGQMHGATLLDADDSILRPAILWNDGRSGAECAELEAACPESRAITGNLAMPGFTAPKLLWAAKHEPRIFDRVARVLLPKDYLRLRMTGEYASDLSDSAGTLWLDVGKRAWSREVLETTGLTTDHMPRLFEGTQVTGTLRAEVAEAWGMDRVPVVAGGGDNAAGAAGVGVIRDGQAFLSLGTSGVYFVANDRFRPNPEEGVHAFCHCLPDTWHQMAVILSAASCLSWLVGVTGAADEEELLGELSAADPIRPSALFLPYLSGERTPHNDPNAQGVFFGMTHETTRAHLTYAVLEGVGFALADGQRVLENTGARIADITVIGGGARSAYWIRLLADILQRPLSRREGGEVGPAYGAARLAHVGYSGAAPGDVCIQPATVDTAEPRSERAALLEDRAATFRALYASLKSSFSPPAT